MPTTITLYDLNEVPRRCRQLGHAYRQPRYMKRFECERCGLTAWLFAGPDEEAQIEGYSGPLLEQACSGEPRS